MVIDDKIIPENLEIVLALFLGQLLSGGLQTNPNESFHFLHAFFLEVYLLIGGIEKFLELLVGYLVSELE